MTNLSPALNRRILALERELRELREVNVKLRDKLLSYAKECLGCDGAGVVTVPDAMQPAFGKQLPCPECEDLRELLL